MGPIDEGAWISGHAGRVVPVAFSLAGGRFVAGDLAGGLVVRARDGERLTAARAPGSGSVPPKVFAVAWSPDNSYVAAIENDVVRLRRASDLAVIAEAVGVGVGPLVFGGKGAWLAIGAGRELSVRAVPSLAEIARVPVERRSLDIFRVDGITADPIGSLVATRDDGGRDEDDDGNTTDRDAPQVTVFDAPTGQRLAVVDAGERAHEVVFDPWRQRLYVVTDTGTSVRSSSGELLSRWPTNKGRAHTPTRHLAVSSTFLATIAYEREDAARRIELWDPWTFGLLGSFDMPRAEAPTWMVASPDGSVLITGGTSRDGDHGMWLWRVTLDRVTSDVAAGTVEAHPALELVRLAGPIVDASTLPREDVERAVAERRVLMIHQTSTMGDADIWLSAYLPPGATPDLVLARVVPGHLREIAEASWDDLDDVYRTLGVERPRTRGRVKRPRPPPRPVFPKVVHEGRGGYVAIDAGWREYRYPIELVGDGRFCIHYPAGNRLRDKAVHLAALEAMCRAEPEKWTLERRDRGNTAGHASKKKPAAKT